MFSRYHGYMAFAKRKKEIAMVKMTFTALQQQIRVLAINTDSVSLYVCFFCLGGGDGLWYIKAKTQSMFITGLQRSPCPNSSSRRSPIPSKGEGDFKEVLTETKQAQGIITRGQSPLNLLFHNGRPELLENRKTRF